MIDCPVLLYGPPCVSDFEDTILREKLNAPRLRRHGLNISLKHIIFNATHDDGGADYAHRLQ